MEQMVDKAITAVMETGLYQTAILEWNNFDEANRTWPQLRVHFTEAYDLLQRSGAGTARDHGYHHGNNAIDEDDDSLGSIMASMHQAHNANATAMNENISVITAESARQKEIIAALQQQVALLSINPPAPIAQLAHPPTTPYYGQTVQPIAAYAAQPPPPPAPVPTYVPINPPTHYQPSVQYGRGGRGGQPRGRGRGRGRGRAPRWPAPSGTIPPPPGQATGAQRPAYSNKLKQ